MYNTTVFPLQQNETLTCKPKKKDRLPLIQSVCAWLCC